MLATPHGAATSQLIACLHSAALRPPLATLHKPPNQQEVVSRLPLCTPEEFNAAVASSKDAFAKWRSVPVPQRARVMFRLQVGWLRGWLAGGLGWEAAAVNRVA